MKSIMFGSKKLYGFVILLALVLFSIGVMSIYLDYSARKRYEEQAVMAEQLLNSGDFKQAAVAYQTALEMKEGNPEELMIGLANSYIGVHEFSMALDVLRECYKKTSGIKVKEKIEEVTLMRTEYEFQEIIKSADIYFANQEFEKAIAEYEKAKLIKSKDMTAYKGIAEAYMARGDYAGARERVLEGLAITQSEELNRTLLIIETNLLKLKYDQMLLEASEYIYQENYEDAIRKYEEAIDLLPDDVRGYLGLGEAHIALGAYDRAIRLVDNAGSIIQSDQLEEIKVKAKSLKSIKEERQRILQGLYKGLNKMEVSIVVDFMSLPFFLDEIASETPLYYSPTEEGNISLGYGMVIYDDSSLYLGTFKNGMRKGMGVFFKLLPGGNKDFYYYEGEWSNDIPNGFGKTVETKKGNSIVTEGKFYNGQEDGGMTKIFKKEGVEEYRISYNAEDGRPLPLKDKNDILMSVKETGEYAIAEKVKENQSASEYYYVAPETYWQVEYDIK